MKLYEGTLGRFGYDLTVVCKTERECEHELLKEYVKAYKRENGTSPSEDIAYDRGSDLTYYELAKEDICIRDFELGKVEWY